MKVKNLIIGGGFAGLYLALILDDAVIIERNDNVGGLLRSFKSESGAFSFDIGGHVYTTKDSLLSELMKSSDAIMFPQRKAYYDYELKVPYPIQYHTDMLGIPISPSPRQTYPSLDALLTHEFGKEFYEKILKPFNQRVWSTNPNQMDPDWVMGRVAPMKDKTPNWGANSSFYYARGDDILNVLLNRQTEVTTFTSTQLKFIDFEEKIAFVEAIHPAVFSGAIRYDNLYDTSGIALTLAGVNLPHNSVVTVGLGLKRMIDEDFHWWYNSVNNSSPIHRITLLSRYHPKMAPKGKDSLLIEIPFKEKTNYGSTVTDQDVMKIGITALLREANFNFIEMDDIAETVVIGSKGYPIPIIAHRQKVATARRSLLHKNVFLVGRWGAHGYYNLDHVIKDAVFARDASLGFNTQDYFWANYYYNEQRRF